MVEFIISLMSAAVQLGTPLLLATLGEIYAERSGVLNLGVEGMMIMGAFSAFMTSYLTGNVPLAFLVAILVGGLLSLIHGAISITLRGNQIVSGIAVTILGLGVSGFLGRRFIGVTAPRMPATPVPILKDLPGIGPILFSQDALVYASLMAAGVMWFILFKTRPGLNIRTVGENPAMADSLGVDVYLTRYICVLLGGILAGLGGAYLSVAYTAFWIEGMTAGRGWIAIALTIFAGWNPLRCIFGAYVFGALDALVYRLQAVGVGQAYTLFLLMIPYAFAIAILALSSTEVIRRKVGMPAALAVPYVRGES